MRNYFTFGPIDSRDYGVYISGGGIFRVPARSYEFVSIPGRSGDIALGGRRLENYELEYPCFIAPVDGSCGDYASYRNAFFAFRNALLSVNGYANLSDTYLPSHYYEAVYVGDMDADSTSNLDAGEFVLVFNCKPQRFISTATLVPITDGNIITLNTNGKRGLPILTLTGTGTLNFFRSGIIPIQDQVSVNQNFPNGLVVDSLLMDCYSVDDHSVSANHNVRFLKYRFPQINPLGEDISSAYIIESNGLDGSISVRWYDL